MKFSKLLREVALLSEDERWRLKQALAGESRYYGDGGTIHHTGHVDIETDRGEVVSVWYRCQLLPFEQKVDVTADRANEMRLAYAEHIPVLTGVEVREL